MEFLLPKGGNELSGFRVKEIHWEHTECEHVIISGFRFDFDEFVNPQKPSHNCVIFRLDLLLKLAWTFSETNPAAEGLVNERTNAQPADVTSDY